MLREIEFHFAGDEHTDPYFTIEQVEVSCGTELANIAETRRREHGAYFVTFGPVIERDEDGLPLYGKKKGRG